MRFAACRRRRGDWLYRWDVTALKRYHLGTPYSAMVEDVVKIVKRPELQPCPRLVIDGSGVGVAVVEMFRTALDDHPDVEAHAICHHIRSGFSLVGRNTWNVAKIEIVGAVREVLESKRVKIARTPSGQPIEFSDILKRELMDFRVKITAAANETFAAREGAHDDLVLATALPIWLGAQRRMHMSTTLLDNKKGFLRTRESGALSAEQQALALAEAEALKLEATGITKAQVAERKRREELDKIAQDNWDDPRWWSE